MKINRASVNASENNKIDNNFKFLDNLSSAKKTREGIFSYGSHENVEMGDKYTKNGNFADSKNPTSVESKVNIEECLNTLKENIMPDSIDLFEEMGMAPDKDNPENVLTVSERIKIELATHCDNYKGDLSNISDADLEELAGSKNLAQSIKSELNKYNIPATKENVVAVKDALDKCEKIADSEGKVPEKAVIVSIKNEADPTIENLYKASFAISTGQGENEKKAESFSWYLNKAQKEGQNKTLEENAKNLNDKAWEQLKSQVEDILNKVNVEITPNRMEAAKMLLHESLPVTLENILRVEETRNANVGSIEINLENIVRNMAFGKEAEDTVLTNNPVTEERAKSAIDSINAAANEIRKNPENSSVDIKLAFLLKEGKELNTCGLNIETNEANVDNFRDEIDTAKKQILEISIMMSKEAGISLLKAGIRIETESFENMVKALEENEINFYNAVVDSSDKAVQRYEINYIRNVQNAMLELGQMPSAIIGEVLKEEVDFTISSLRKNGAVLREKMEKAGERYETLGTEIRKDLGDSIKKAFKSSIDEILRDLGLENTERNQKAVRVLAYNNMEITKENIEKVKCLDLEVEDLMKNLTPRTVVKLLKDGINPLDTNIVTLNDSLREMNETFKLKEESYSEFLWKLDNKKEAVLSNEEREAYIGLFRTFNLMAKDDFQALGYLLNTGAEITINNMVNAVRAKREKGMEIAVDDTFEGLRDIAHGKNLNYQLAAFERNATFETRYTETLLEKTTSNLTPEGLKEAFNENIGEMTLEKFSEYFEDNKYNYSSEYEADRILKMFDELKEEPDFATMLKEAGENPSLINQLALKGIFAGRKGAFKKLEDELPDITEKYENVEDVLDSEDEIIEELDSFRMEAYDALEEKVDYEDIDKLDLQNIKMANTEISLLNNLSKDRFFQIPLRVGNETMAVNLTVVEGKDEKGKIKIDFEDENLGIFKLELTATGKLKGDIYAANDEALLVAEKIKDSFCDALEENGFVTAGINVIKYENTRKTGLLSTMDDNESRTEVKTQELFSISKIYLGCIKNVFA